MKTYRIATLPGDGIGKEVVPAGRQAMEALAAAESPSRFESETCGRGGDGYRAHGSMMPEDGGDALRGKDATRFASAGDPHIPPHHPLAAALAGSLGLAPPPTAAVGAAIRSDPLARAPG